MELRVNFNSFVKIKDVTKINDICGEILDYQLLTDKVSGKLGVNGKYYKSDLEKEYSFTEEIPFDILFTSPNFELIDVDCIDLNYDLIDGRGLDVNFDIRVEYNELINEEEFSERKLSPGDDDENETIELDSGDTKDESSNELDLDERELNIDEIVDKEIEEVKEEITNNVSNKLINALNVKDNNLPTEEVTELFEEERTVIKVCYYNSDKELESLCNKNDISLDKVFKDNKNNDIEKYQRVIIK